MARCGWLVLGVNSRMVSEGHTALHLLYFQSNQQPSPSSASSSFLNVKLRRLAWIRSQLIRGIPPFCSCGWRLPSVGTTRRGHFVVFACDGPPAQLVHCVRRGLHPHNLRPWEGVWEDTWRAGTMRRAEDRPETAVEEVRLKFKICPLF